MEFVLKASRSKAVGCALAAVFWIGSQVEAAGTPLRPTGSAPISAVELETVPDVSLGDGIKRSLPAQYELPHLPPPDAEGQGENASCVAFAIASLSAHQQKKKSPSWDLSEPSGQFSPMYVYNQLNGGRKDATINLLTALQFVQAQGIATRSVMPHKNSDLRSQPSWEARKEAYTYRFGTIEKAGITQGAPAAVVDGLKKLLFEKKSPLIFTALVDNGFGELEDGMVWRGLTSNYGDSHAMLLVGWDNNRTDRRDGKIVKAFKVLNSWKEWGDIEEGRRSGIGWVEQEALAKAIIRDSRAAFVVGAGNGEAAAPFPCKC
jgi:C1A family cysteine protease